MITAKQYRELADILIELRVNQRPKVATDMLLAFMEREQKESWPHLSRFTNYSWCQFRTGSIWHYSRRESESLASPMKTLCGKTFPGRSYSSGEAMLEMRRCNQCLGVQQKREAE